MDDEDVEYLRKIIELQHAEVDSLLNIITVLTSAIRIGVTDFVDISAVDEIVALSKKEIKNEK